MQKAFYEATKGLNVTQYTKVLTPIGLGPDVNNDFSYPANDSLSVSSMLNSYGISTTVTSSGVYMHTTSEAKTESGGGDRTGDGGGYGTGFGGNGWGGTTTGGL